MSKLLNVQVHPELKSYSLGRVTLSYTRHAAEQANKKGVKVLQHLDIIQGSVVEAELDSRNTVIKLVVRVKQDSINDAVFVVAPKSKGFCVVITCWLNHFDDTHKTLRKERLLTA